MRNLEDLALLGICGADGLGIALVVLHPVASTDGQKTSAGKRRVQTVILPQSLPSGDDPSIFCSNYREILMMMIVAWGAATRSPAWKELEGLTFMMDGSTTGAAFFF